MPLPCQTVLSTFLAHDSAAQLKRRLSASPPVSVRSSTPAFIDVPAAETGKLGRVALPVRNVDRRGERDRRPRDGGDLLDFGGGAIQPREPGAGGARRGRKRVGGEVIHIRDCRFVLLPNDAPVRRCPDLSAALRVRLPIGARGFVQQHHLTRREPCRVRYIDGVCSLDGIGGEIRGSSYVHCIAARSKQRGPDDNQRRRLCADGASERLGAVGLRQRRLAGAGAAQRDAFVDQQIVAVVDQERARGELHDLSYRTCVDAALDPWRIVLRSAGRQRGADRGSGRDAAHAPHARVPESGTVSRQECARILDGGRRRCRLSACHGGQSDFAEHQSDRGRDGCGEPVA